MMTPEMVPDYLRPVQYAPRYYGTLKYNQGSNRWEIEGEPCVIEAAKRLFPGCDTKCAGRVVFNNHKRANGDLNWLMLRYPLTIENPEEWGRSLQEATEHVIGRQKIYESPQRVIPPATFTGQLRPFQEEGLAFMLLNRRTLLADEMGLGKTVEALALLSSTGGYPALIIVPPYLVPNWKKEIKRFMVLPGGQNKQPRLFDVAEDPESNIHVLHGLKPYDLPEANIYIIHYLLLRGWKKYLPDFGFKTVIFDEIQELRHARTEKYSAASLVADAAPDVFGLSGTPIYNRGAEIWNVINILEFHALGSFDSFTREWCNGYGSEVVRKPGLLGDYLKREGLMLRRRKDDVLDDLPPKRRVVQTVDYDSGIYSQLIQRAIEKAKVMDTITDAFEKGRAMREIVNSARQATGISKAPYVAAFVKMLLEAGERVLLFAYHHKVFDLCMDTLKEFKPVRITGAETAKEKDQSIEAFKRGETPVAIISLRSTAGLDGLQNATCVVFGELDWSPAVHSQAEDRAHRMGQKDSVLCYYLVCEEGTDADIQEALGLKVSQFIGLMGDRIESEDDRYLAQVVATEHMQHIIERLKTRADNSQPGTVREEYSA